MDIAIYIAEFLHQHNEVSLPGVGTFFKQRINGYFDSKKNSYVPPRQFLAFRISDRENNYLTEYLTEVKNISEASAQYFINKYAEKVKDFIATSGHIELTSLGVLRKTPTGYQFEPSKEFNFATDFYGLQPVAETVELSSSKTVDFTPTSEKKAAEQNVVKQIEPEPIDSVNKSNRSKYLIPFFLLLVAIAGVVVYNYIPQFTPSFKLPPLQKQADTVLKDIPTAALDSSQLNSVDSAKLVIVDTLKPLDSISKTYSIKNNTLPLDTVSDKKITFEIIASSLNRQADAEKIVRNFRTMGVTAHIVYTKKRKNKLLISVGSFTDRKAADEQLIEIRKKIQKDAYIYINKPQ